ncbi:MAG TPA: hypothetical protein VJT49_10090 [Amycolatopsis sp.]|uniref:hypothetical protein n=1 Tax=Amycolatopsis sp. TaxID=37632 RepID=UPI002B47E3FB|nr:hypothetical protein [Amycolatopsis sp.]HJQ45778.1 hypothetical protein [Amycolatopsis sp.]HKS45448.1 hypothetical protein [Amycolatopsis sp.]
MELEFSPAVVPPLLTGVRGPKSPRVSGAPADGTILAEPSAPEYVRAARAAIEEDRAEPHRTGSALDRHLQLVRPG